MNLDEIYQKLDLVGKGGFVSLSSPDWSNQIQIPERVLRLIKDKKCPLSQVSAMFCFGGKPLIFFFENPQEESSLHKAIWNLNEIPIVVIGKEIDIEVFNGFAYEKELSSLHSLGGEEVLNNFNYFKIVTGQGWDEYKSKLASHNRVDYYLLRNIQYAQEQIQKYTVSRNLANRLIGKMIFLRYLTDRHVMLSFEGQTKVLTKDDIIELLQNKKRLSRLFDILQDKNKGFNGDLFKITHDELDSVPDEALNVLVRLLRCDDLGTGEYSLFDVYDFSILPVEFISNVYERFIGKENQEKKGAYYTPLFLVDYIVENTVAKHLKSSRESTCKILDPACGSGIFLVESLRRIIDHYISVADKQELVGEKFQNKLKQLALDNIFGIDSDLSAIQVAAFSIYLTLLDYQKPADISKFQFPNLMETNLICQDSFCDAPFVGIAFDYVLGNPPWKRGGKEYDEAGDEIMPEYQKYIKNRELAEQRNRIIGNQEIAQAFIVRTFDFMSSNTQAALVLTSKVLYNSQSCQFRSYLLENAQIESVLELSSVRHEVFSHSSDPSIAPACVLFYERKSINRQETEHLITHIAVKPSVFFSLFKVLTVEKADIQRVRQDLLYQNDFLWKILLYGSYLDFIFVKRLREKWTIQQEIDERGYLSGVGVTCGKELTRHDDISDYVGKKKIDARNLRQYVISPSNELWKEATAHRGREKELFKAPLLLVRKSIDSSNFSCRAAICLENAIFTGSITGIHGDSLDVLRNIAGLLNSRLFSYYALMCMSSMGIEREQGHNTEKFSLPYLSGGINKVVEKIERKYEDFIKHLLQSQESFETQIKREKEKIEESITRELNLSEAEQSLIDYANNYAIPLATGKAVAMPLKDDRKGRNLIADYARVFLRRFEGQFGEGLSLNCCCEISPTHVMMRFTVAKDHKPLEYIKGSYRSLEAFLLAISTESLSDQLYLRKDIRGFEKDGFYIIKPCEQRLWHPAMAYVDVQEFADALIMNKNK